MNEIVFKMFAFAPLIALFVYMLFRLFSRFKL